MQHVNRYVQTFWTPKFIAKAGKRAIDLKPFEMGLFDQETQMAVDVADYCIDKSYVLKYKSASTGVNNAQFGDTRGAGLPLESYPIQRIDFSKSFDRADAMGRPYVYYLGWDGISDCKTLSFECGRDYGLQITVRGETVRDTFGHNLTEIVPFTTGCCDDCGIDEACDKTVASIMAAIEQSTFYIDNYFTVEPVKSCCPAEAPFAKKIYKKWKIALCDTGDAHALGELQVQYPDYDITLVDRDGATSTYEICIADGVTPADFTLTKTGVLVCDDCPDCPTAFTKVEAGDKYIVTFDSAAGAGVTTLEQFDVAYYTDPNTAQATVDGLVETAGALVPGYVATTADIMSVTSEKLVLQVIVATGTDVSEHGLTDVTLTNIGTSLAQCVGSETFSWSECDEVYKISRKLCMQFKKEDCARTDAYYLDKVTKAMAGAPDVVDGTLAIKSSNDCMISFEIEQCNNACLEDGCDTYGKDGAKFDRLPSFEGHLWDMCDCEGWTVDDSGCPVPPADTTADACLCGLKFTGALIDRECIPCNDDIDDDVPREPIQLEFTLIDQYNEEECDPLDMPVFEAQVGKMPEGLGQFAKRNEVLSRLYDGYIYTSPKAELGGLMAHRLGYQYDIDPCKTYNYIYLRHTSKCESYYVTDAQGTRKREEITLAFDSRERGRFEEFKNFLNKTLLAHGKCSLL